jgi:cyclophilin family peptidyl-prolyl cis-trans isomerase
MLEPVLVQLHEKYPDEVRIVSRYFPLSMHQNAFMASQAAEAAGAQGKFHEMSGILYEQQGTWGSMTQQDFAAWLDQQAVALGLDQSKFDTDLVAQSTVDRVNKDLNEGTAAGVTGTPYLFVNGGAYQGARSLDVFSAIVELYKLEPLQYTECPPTVIDPSKQYTAPIKTNKGDIVIELFADKAPVAVNSFVFLARAGWFDNNIFHRVISGFVAQTGDPTGTGAGGPGYVFGDEITDLKFDKPGVVGMANSGENTNGSQFFITFDAIPDLDGRYTIFGQVTSGMDVVQSLTPRDPSQGGALPAGDEILSITIQEQ